MLVSVSDGDPYVLPDRGHSLARHMSPICLVVVTYLCHGGYYYCKAYVAHPGGDALSAVERFDAFKMKASSGMMPEFCRLEYKDVTSIESAVVTARIPPDAKLFEGKHMESRSYYTPGYSSKVRGKE